MGKTAFVFSGQGAQYPGMGREIYEASEAARAVFDVSESQRPGTAAQCFSGSREELSVTLNTQPCLYTVDLAIAEAVRELGIVPDAVAGFSLGEVAALTFAGVMSREEGFWLVQRRASLMNDAAKKHPGTMAAVMRLAPDKVRELAEECGVYAVNYNSPQQTVAAGEKEKMAAFAAKVKELRGMAVPLAVSGAFHSPLMKDAADGLAEALAEVTYRAPEMPVYANSTAEPYPLGEMNAAGAAADAAVDAEAAAKRLTAAQVKSPVYWQRTIENMTAAGFDTFIEVGAGKTLTGLIAKIAPQATAVKVENAADLAALASLTEAGKEK